MFADSGSRPEIPEMTTSSPGGQGLAGARGGVMSSGAARGGWRRGPASIATCAISGNLAGIAAAAADAASH